MSVQDNKQMMRRFFEEVVSDGQMNLIEKLIAEDFIEHEDFPGEQPTTSGRATLEAGIEQIRTGIPDIEVTVDKMLGEGDLVTAHTTWKGTHTGDLWGIEPSNAEVEYRCIDIVRFEDGQAVEHWGLSDNLTMMTQIGAIEPPSI